MSAATLIPTQGVGSLLESCAGDLPSADLYGPLGAGVYDAVAVDDLEEARLVSALARGAGGLAVDLAAGSGRLTLPLAARGFDVLALDSSRPMLDRLTRRLATAPARLRDRVTVSCADVTAVELPARCALVVLGATSIGLFDPPARARMLRRVAGALAPGGRALVSVTERAPTAGCEQTSLLALPERGLLATLIERVDADAGHREVLVLPTLVDGKPVAPVLLRSRIALVDAPALVATAGAAGLRERARHALGSDAVLLELEVAA